MDSEYDDGGEILRVVELSTILELEVPDDDERLFPRLACSQASGDRKEVFKFSLSLVVK